MIKIHYDFTDGTEMSYVEGLKMGDNFSTCCLDFFTVENPASDVVIITQSGSTISRNKLINNEGDYTAKEIRKEHDILKMFKAGSFDWKAKVDTVESFDDYHFKMAILEKKHLGLKNALVQKYGLSKAKYKVGDTIRDGATTILVERITVSVMFGGTSSPEPVYRGIELKKDLTPKKSGDVGVIYGSHQSIVLVKKGEIKQ